MDFAFAGRMFAACAVIAVVLAVVHVAVRAAARSWAGRNPRGGRLVRVLETTLLPNASSLHVIRVADRYLVIGRSGAHIAALCDVPRDAIDAWRGHSDAS